MIPGPFHPALYEPGGGPPRGAVTRYWSPTLDDLIATDWEVIDESTLPIE